MKQFNLQEYLKNPSQKVALRSGSDVRIICTDKKGEFPIVALVEDDDDEGEFTICYRKTGRFLIERESPNDLIFATEKKSKFDPKTLKPFDKVLVKDDDTCNWRTDFYSNKGKSKKFPYMCVGVTCKYCIPYNNNTKHLVGTNDEAPEYYRYWEK